jgi:hypothetical protein
VAAARGMVFIRGEFASLTPRNRRKYVASICGQSALSERSLHANDFLGVNTAWKAMRPFNSVARPAAVLLRIPVI